MHEGSPLVRGEWGEQGGELTPRSEGFDPSERGVARRKALHTFLLISVDFQTQKEVRSCDSKVVQEGRGLPHGLIFWEEGCWIKFSSR